MATQTDGANETRPLDRPTGGGDSKASADVANTGNIEKGMSFQGVPFTPQLRSPTNYGPVPNSPSVKSQIAIFDRYLVYVSGCFVVLCLPCSKQ
jgi:hypothetical protein